jgi:heme a synthase
MRRLTSALPSKITRSVRAWSWTTLVVQILIVVTGGAVRLTASGLGCPTWPLCTEDSLVSTPEMGIHGLIEFGNRLLTFVLVAVAVVTFALVSRLRRSRPEIFWLALVIGLGIPAQAVIGGISVLTQLNPYVVGFHFVVSAVMIVLSTILVARTYVVAVEPIPAARRSKLLFRGALLVATLQTLTVLLGILVTGSGPHAGDAEAPRNGLNSELWQHLHSVPAYAAVFSAFALGVIAWRMHRRDVVRVVIALLIVNVIQVAVGLAQANLGLPVLLVGLHMFLACLVISATTWLVLTARTAVTDQSR